MHECRGRPNRHPSAQAGVKLVLPKADVSNKTIQVDGRVIKLMIVRPAGSKQTLPAFMFFHGCGGWVLGDFPTHERLVRDLVTQSGAVAVFVNYTPSPEAGYGVALDKAYAATKWVAEHGKGPVSQPLDLSSNGECRPKESFSRFPQS